MVIKDHLLRKITVDGDIKSIISLVPSQTELLVDLGLEDCLVGITKFCIHPKHLKKNKTIVGGTKKVHYDKIKALNPQIIICNKEENTPEMVSELSKIAPVWVSEIINFDDVLRLITDFGNIFSKKEKSKIICEELLELKEKFFINHTYLEQKKVLYLIWKSPWMSINNNTFISHVLNLLGFENFCAESIDRYPILTINDAFEKAKPDLVFLSSEPFPFNDTHLIEFSESYNIQINKIYLVDGEYFSWYGTRLLKAFDYFNILINSIKK